MIITGALPWWNELPEDLAACIRGLGNVVDRVIAVDGSYARYPEATARSSQAEVDAIEQTAKEIGLECLIIQPSKVWAGQIEKRTYLLAMASVKSDWICTVDADHVIHAERAAVRLALENSTADVIEVPYFTPPNPERSMRDSAVGYWHEEQVGVRVNIPHLYRSLPGMRIENRHWCYSGIKDGRRVWLWGDDPSYPILPHQGLGVPYEVEHRCLMRTSHQIRLSRGFVNDREMVVRLTGQEDDIIGLPPPVFDFDRIPA